MREYKVPVKKAKIKPTNNIKDYDKILYTLTKPHSPHSIAFVEDPNDDWFVFIKEYKTKSGDITYSEIITEKDLLDRLDHFERLGHKIEKLTANNCIN